MEVAAAVAATTLAMGQVKGSPLPRASPRRWQTYSSSLVPYPVTVYAITVHQLCCSHICALVTWAANFATEAVKGNVHIPLAGQHACLLLD